MIRTLDVSDFIEPKKKRMQNTIYKSNLSILPADNLQQSAVTERSRELFGIKARPFLREKGTVLYKEGMSARNFYLLQEGKVSLSCSSDRGNTIVEDIKPSEFFGIESLFCGKWLATAIIEGDARLYEFKKDDAINAIDFTDRYGLLKIFEGVYVGERIKLMLNKMQFFDGIDAEEKKIILDKGVIVSIKKGQAIDLEKDYSYIVIEGKINADINGVNTTYKNGDIICKPSLKATPAEDGELLKMNKEIVSKVARVKTFIEKAGKQEIKHEIKQENKQEIKKENDNIRKDAVKKIGLNKHEARLCLSESSVFADIGLEERCKIADYAELISYQKESEIIKAATRGENRFYIIKKGQVKGIRANSRGNSVTTYYEEGDFLGEMSFVYDVENTETIISLTDVELIAIDKNTFKDLYENHSGFKKAIINRIKEKAKEQAEIENNLKAAGITNFMIENGLTYATRLKVYEANKCIGCLSCVKACKGRHGTARFKRVNIRYSFVNIPQSCRTCKYPTCLSKCRKDAIRREKDGEIVINSNCVGCGLCAKSCRFGAIEVFELDADSKDAKPKRRAIKCDHCREYDNCACVSECPTGAIKHVEPKGYFKQFSY